LHSVRHFVRKKRNFSAYPTLTTMKSYLPRTYPDRLWFFAEAKLYLIAVPCAIGVVLVSFLVGAIVLMCRRRSSSGAAHPRMQMSLLNDDDHFSTTQITDVESPNEANLPVYRPTTQKIKT